ncbi:MAG TPA: alpha/beta hydrolase-fold protein [Terriglobia bacterium]|nr:alpha/beta hydrolase-fold protein [Terriglobia bacterium]
MVLIVATVCLQPATGRAAEGSGPTTLDCGQIPSKLVSAPLNNYCVALPGGYSASSARYPVMYFLHGMFEDEQSWAERGGKAILDALLAKGQVGPFIVVLPNAGKTFYVNSFDGKVRYEDYFVQEIIPYIDQHYRTIAKPASRGIFGISMGGYGALHLAMRHPDLFGSVSAQSAALLPKFPDPLPSTGRWGFYARVLQEPFGSPLNESYFDANNPLTLAEHPEAFEGLKMYFDCGKEDRYGFNEGNALLDQVLSSKSFPHQFALREGNHGWSYEDMYMQDALLFEWQGFGQASKSAAAGGAHGRSK